MPLEIVYGESRDRISAGALAETLAGAVEEGTVYLGYPVLATADERIEVDTLLVSSEHGLVAFLLAESVPGNDEEWAETVEDQDRLYAILESNLRRHDGLRAGRHLALKPHTATVFPGASAGAPDTDDGFYGGIEAVPEWVQSLEPIEESIERALQAALQRVSTIKPPKKRAKVERADYRRDNLI
jgi:superfamily I DNA and RNA helicase